MDELLKHIQEVLEELKDVHENIETLEKLFQSFSKVQHAALKERTQLRKELARETARAVTLAITAADIEIIGRLCVKMWLQLLIQFCSEITTEGWGVLLKAKKLGWIDAEDMPTAPDFATHEAGDVPKPPSEKD